MDSLLKIILAGIVILVAFLYLNRNKRAPGYPPGPRPLPVLGNVFQLIWDPLKVLQKWIGEYGPIYSMKIGTQDTIVLSDAKLVKELFSDVTSTGRTTHPIPIYFGNGYGVIMAQGHSWETQRRFTLRKLRDVGAFKSSIETVIIEERSLLINFLKQNVGTSVTGLKLFNGPVVNALWRTISGEKFDWTASEKPEIQKNVSVLIESVNRTVRSGLFFAPFLRHIAPNFFGWTAWVRSVDNFGKQMAEAVEKHIEKLNPNNPQDFIDHYLNEMRTTKDPTSSFFQDTGEKNLRAVLADLFIAGTESNASTLSFATLYLSRNKEAQRKAQKELDQVIGSSQCVSLSDKLLLPCTEAIVLETLRLSSVIPLGLPHRMTEDTMFHGHFLPKDVTVIANLYGIHHDPKVWGDDVNEFRPERFLSKDQRKVIRHDALITFSAGRRSCPGDGFAKDTIFLFIADILQKFIIEPDPECPDVDSEPMPGLALKPKPFKIVFKLRDGLK